MRRFFPLGILTLLASCVTSTIAYGASLDVNGLPAWRLTLENEDVQQLKQGVVLTVLVANPDPVITKAIAAAIQVIDTVNEIGGRKGVEIIGILGTSNLVIVPKGSGGFYGELVKVRNEIDKMGRHWEGIFRENGDKISKGWKKWTGQGGGRKDNPWIARGTREKVGEWERFRLIALPDNQVAFATHKGYLWHCKELTGIGGSARAESYVIGEGEQFTLKRVPDGSTIIESIHGHYLNSPCSPDDLGLPNPGSLTNFFKATWGFNVASRNLHSSLTLEFQADGTVAIKSHDDKYMTISDD